MLLAHNCPYTAEQLQQMERQLMAYRYAYYIECDPLVPDRSYDLLEQVARRWLPGSSPIQRVGSDLSSDYTPEEALLVQKLRSGAIEHWFWVDTTQ